MKSSIFENIKANINKKTNNNNKTNNIKEK